MFELNECIKILDTESRYFHDNARHYKNSLTGLITLGVGSLVAMIALIKTNQITVPDDLQTLVPYYTAILLISYGLFLLYQWYNVKIVSELIEESDVMPSDKEVFSSASITGDPFGVIFNLSFLIGFVATIFTLSILLSKRPFWFWFLVITWVALILIIALRITYYRNKNKSRLAAILRLTSNGLIFYPSAIGLLITGFIFLMFIPVVGGVDNFIITLYMVELQIVIVQGLSFYKSQAENNMMAYRLDGLRYKIIHEEVKIEDFLLLHEKIFKKRRPKARNVNAIEVPKENADRA